MNADTYLDWLAAGNESEHLDRVRGALNETPRTRRQIAERADVSYQFASIALEVLIQLGEAEESGTCRARSGHLARLYVRSRRIRERLEEVRERLGWRETAPGLTFGDAYALRLLDEVIADLAPESHRTERRAA